MKIINLRDFYPWYTHDEFIEVTDLVADTIDKMEREEHAYYERRRYHRAFYSLNFGDGIEGSAIHAPTPEAVYEAELERLMLYATLAALPAKQRKRVFQHYILGMGKAEIAHHESVSEKNIRQAIVSGLQNLLELFQKNF